MNNSFLKKISSRPLLYQNLLCSFLVTLIFSVRWLNCLPFSGYMPLLKNTDVIGFWGRYIVYAREPLGFPLGLIKSLSFPFQVANITVGSMPLFGLLFKILSKVYKPFAEFYYFPLVEMIAVFLTCYFACLLLEEFKIKFFWPKFLISVLTGLSFPLLFQSSVYFEATVHVCHSPIYLAFAYFYIKLFKNHRWYAILPLIIILVIAGLTEYYVLMALLLMLTILIIFSFYNWLINKNQVNKKNLFYVILTIILGGIFSLLALSAFGNQKNLGSYPNISPLINRYGTKWGYGGGDGGGFHVADVLTLFIPPKENQDLPINKTLGPTAYLAQLGFPITANNLQAGQYEGFAYLGSTTIGILLFLIIINLITIEKNREFNWVKFKLNLEYKLLMVKSLSIPKMFGIATFALYVMSWGYILHIGGVRLNDLTTPSLLIAMIWPNFMFARSLGRLALPFMLYVTFSIVIIFTRFLWSSLNKNKQRNLIIMTIMVILVLLHANEVKDYLKPQEVVYGNDIANMFGGQDKIVIKRLLKNKKALMVVPGFAASREWAKICYSLAFHSQIPLSGETIGPPGERPEHLQRYTLDVKTIMAGNIREVVNRYGEVAIAAPNDIAESILAKTDIPLQNYKLQDQNVTILTIDI